MAANVSGEASRKALAFVQSAWALGYGLAALVNLIVMPLWGWRGVFFVGIAPALLTLWIRRNLEDPVAWRTSTAESRGDLAALFTPARARITIAIMLMNAATLYSGFGAVIADLYPTAIRATAAGVCDNVGIPDAASGSADSTARAGLV